MIESYFYSDKDHPNYSIPRKYHRLNTLFYYLLNLILQVNLVNVVGSIDSILFSNKYSSLELSNPKKSGDATLLPLKFNILRLFRSVNADVSIDSILFLFNP